MKAAKLVALFLATGCAVDADTESVAQASDGSAYLLPECGTGQRRAVTSSFEPLAVTLTDANGAPITNAAVVFTAPTSGASAVLEAGGITQTDNNGRAEIRAAATSAAGTYTVWAHADGAAPMPFVLTNVPGAPARLTAVLGTNQTRKTGMPFAQPLTVEVHDRWGNAIEGATVEYVAPFDGPTTRMNASTAVTDNAGRAAVLATAGDLVGSYTVVARIADADTATFALANTHTDFTRPTLRTDALHAFEAP